MTTTNPTNRKRLARALADASGIGYQKALSIVVEASAEGLLPGRLDEDGRHLALEALLSRNPAKPLRTKNAAHYPKAEPRAAREAGRQNEGQ
ncbi:hypothetical protein EAS64_10410 [Trebonia kvetii]|uniref:Uncharacterized protein n=1 Tax=Trebonia kvetii TaxID=2480626 RepID=A0A6P2C0Y4_9ACTN|nr:hypothetical protein [Trebonia kvetii]TVZ05024.1 hypothetical protein EAS64_10410 [Trebonia kvetii]